MTTRLGFNFATAIGLTGSSGRNSGHGRPSSEERRGGRALSNLVREMSFQNLSNQEAKQGVAIFGSRTICARRNVVYAQSVASPARLRSPVRADLDQTNELVASLDGVPNT